MHLDIKRRFTSVLIKLKMIYKYLCGTSYTSASNPFGSDDNLGLPERNSTVGSITKAVAKKPKSTSKINNNSFGINQELTVFVPQNDNIKINKINLRNNMPVLRKLKIVYYIKPVLGADETKTSGYINIERDDTFNVIYLKNMVTDEFKNEICYVSSSEKIDSYTGSVREFFGENNLSNPEGLNLDKFSNSNSLGQNSILALEFNVEIEPYGLKEISIMLGSTDSKEVAKDLSYKYYKISNCNNELENVKNFWKETLGVLQVNTPAQSTNILLNGWLQYQAIAARLWARTGFYQSGGAFGFRDQLQDSLSLLYTNPDEVKKQILEHAKHQFIEGDVEHWWHKESQKGIRTRFSDDLLWLRLYHVRIY